MPLASSPATFANLGGDPTDNAALAAALALKADLSDVVGLLDLKASLDASTNPNYPATSLKGDARFISVAGKVGGASGKTVEAGDLLICLTDNAGGTEASVGTSWSVIQSNLIGITADGLSLIQAANHAAQAALLPAVVGDSGAGGTKGLVPAPATGDAAAGKFLKANGSWATPAGGATITDPNVGYVRSDGNNTTGDGSPGAPVLTWQKAFDLGFRVFDFGVGSFGSLVIPGVLGADIELTLFGRGHYGDLASQIGNLSIESQSAVNIYLTLCGVVGGAMSNTPAKADVLLTGGNAGTLHIRAVGQSTISEAISIGGEGGDGDAGGSSGWGGNGGSLVISGPVTVATNVAAYGGYPGVNNGGGAGSAGSDGTITLREMCVTPTPSPTPTVIAAIVNGAFVAS